MKYDYTKLQGTAVSLIDKFGRNTTLREEITTGDEFDPTITDSDTTITAVFIKYRADEVDGTLIRKDDKMVLTYANVHTKHKIIDEGVTYDVINVDEIKPADTTIVYKVQVRA